MDIAELLAFSVKHNASDLHLSAGLPPMIRVDGDIRRINVPELPRRVVASIRRRRPTPSAPTHVALETLAHVIAEQGVHQPGVHPETGNLLNQRSG